jgi:hypothetical protein
MLLNIEQITQIVCGKCGISCTHEPQPAVLARLGTGYRCSGQRKTCRGDQSLKTVFEKTAAAVLCYNLVSWEIYYGK